MSPGRAKLAPPSGLTGSPRQQRTAASRPNRLRRSFRQTQRTQTAAEVDSPKSQQPDFKTPTRIRTSRAAGGFSAESPHNDSDFQQDIIWDATSPSPNRLGKRGKKQPAGVVDISEIVSRIAPKHGRPKVAEPTLQQWIGDSAAIPCTPDVRVPKPKKRSPRPNGVDDLLKLAKQFDFNMFHQDDEEEEEVVGGLHQQSLELLSGDILDPSPPGSCQPAVEAAAGTGVQVRLDTLTEDDLDFLFDGPTQHVSGNLSQVSAAQPSQVKPASSGSSKEASGKPSASSHAPTSAVSATDAKGASANDEFDDDWDNDDLLNDSLMLEMTQNPQNFTAPKHCSTQKPSADIRYQSPAGVPVSGGAGRSQSPVSKAEKDSVRQRTTFKLESNPGFSVERIQTDTLTNSKVDFSPKAAEKDTRRGWFSSSKGASVEPGCQRTWQTSNTGRSGPQKPQFHQGTSVASSAVKYNAAASTASKTSVTKTSPSFPRQAEVLRRHGEAPAASDLPDEDLYPFFSSDPVWDDPADDDLLCEMCEDVENQLQNASSKRTLPVGHVSNQRAALQPANRTQQPSNQQPLRQKQTAAFPCASGPPGGAASAGGLVSGIAAGVQTNTATDSRRFAQTKASPGSTHGSACRQGGSGAQSAPRGNARKDQFTFKKPSNPVPAVTNKVVGKCSAAEIELKKQQAMERRRQRLQAARDLRAPT